MVRERRFWLILMLQVADKAEKSVDFKALFLGKDFWNRIPINF